MIRVNPTDSISSVGRRRFTTESIIVRHTRKILSPSRYTAIAVVARVRRPLHNGAVIDSRNLPVDRRVRTCRWFSGCSFVPGGYRNSGLLCTAPPVVVSVFCVFCRFPLPFYVSLCVRVNAHALCGNTNSVFRCSSAANATAPPLSLLPSSHCCVYPRHRSRKPSRIDDLLRSHVRAHT